MTSLEFLDSFAASLACGDGFISISGGALVTLVHCLGLAQGSLFLLDQEKSSSPAAGPAYRCTAAIEAHGRTGAPPEVVVTRGDTTGRGASLVAAYRGTLALLGGPCVHSLIPGAEGPILPFAISLSSTSAALLVLDLPAGAAAWEAGQRSSVATAGALLGLSLRHAIVRLQGAQAAKKTARITASTSALLRLCMHSIEDGEGSGGLSPSRPHIGFVDVVSTTLSSVYSITMAARVSLFLVEPEREGLLLVSSADAAGLRLTVGKGLAGWVAQHGKQVLVEDAYTDGRFSPAVDTATGFTTRSVCAVPLWSDGTAGGRECVVSAGVVPDGLVGILQVCNRTEDGSCGVSVLLNGEEDGRGGAVLAAASTYPFTPADAEALCTLGAAAATALFSVRRFEELTRSRRLESARLTVARAAAGSADFERGGRRFSFSKGILPPTPTSTGRLGAGLLSLASAATQASLFLVDCASASLLLLDTRRGELWVVATTREEARGLFLPLGGSLASDVVSNGEPLVLADASAHASYAEGVDSQLLGPGRCPAMLWPLFAERASERATEGGRLELLGVLVAAGRRHNAKGVHSGWDSAAGAMRDGTAVAHAPAHAPVSPPSLPPHLARAEPSEGAAPFQDEDVDLWSAFSDEVRLLLRPRAGEASLLKANADATRAGAAAAAAARAHAQSVVSRTSNGSFSERSRSNSFVRPTSLLGGPPHVLFAPESREEKEEDFYDVGVYQPAPEATPEELHMSLLSAYGGEGGGHAGRRRASAVATSTRLIATDDAVCLVADVPLPGWDERGLESIPFASSGLASWAWDVWALPLVGLPAVPTPLFQEGPEPAPSLASDSPAAGEMRLRTAVRSCADALGLLSGEGGRWCLARAPFDAFLASLRRTYGPYPFHNWAHAVSVSHAVTLLLAGRPNGSPSRIAACLTRTDIVAGWLAALCHDAGHTGTNNSFHVATLSPLACAHNDDAVLERHHAATAWALLTAPSKRGATPLVGAPHPTSVLGGLDFAATRSLRRTLLRAILHTDMSVHMATVAALRERAHMHERVALHTREGEGMGPPPRRVSIAYRGFSHPPGDGTPTASRSGNVGRATPLALSAREAPVPLPFDRDSSEERDLLVSALVHTADLSGQAYGSSIGQGWSVRVMTEFRAQARAEAVLGLEPTPFMASLSTPLQAARLQAGFLHAIVLPLWGALAALFPGGEGPFEEPLVNLAAAKNAFEAEIAASGASA